MNNDNNVLQFAKYVIGFEIIDVYVEHNVDNHEIVDARKLGTNIDDDDDDVQCTSFRSANIEVNDSNIVYEHNVEVNDEHVKEMNGDCNIGNHNIEVNDKNAEEMSGDGNVVDDHNVEVNDENVEEMSDDGNVDEGYVASEDSFEDSEFSFSEESEEIDWTKVLPLETLGEVSSGNKK